MGVYGLYRGIWGCMETSGCLNPLYSASRHVVRHARPSAWTLNLRRLQAQKGCAGCTVEGMRFRIWESSFFN